MKKWLVYLLCFLCCVCMSAMAYSQPEEEEEPVQARPNPFDHYFSEPKDELGLAKPTGGEMVADDGRHGDGKVAAGQMVADDGQHGDGKVAVGPGGHYEEMVRMERQQRMAEKDRPGLEKVYQTKERSVERNLNDKRR